ncbi:predicted protein [Histoplasma mississippiense (nom. inval.)]|uniref:predicted protein n=1 Tax=Ajellomyces capsulatus (strain NAm1 / WU24) TaxID=2059318 RepID=UPI000157BC9B|nr:predicted protein [Histoplasma mississippiense (nom. inval.)]EDN06103.1 predicted protein [Histoplasma mississippiense (nom. inval.)]
MLVVNMIKSFVPSIHPLFSQLNEFATEPTPELELPITTDLIMSRGLLCLLVVKEVFGSEVLIEFVFSVEKTGTIRAPQRDSWREILTVWSFHQGLISAGYVISRGMHYWTTPAPELEMLGVLVTLPVVFTSKTLKAPRMSAAVGSRMALLVLPRVYWLAINVSNQAGVKRKSQAYFRWAHFRFVVSPV